MGCDYFFGYSSVLILINLVFSIFHYVFIMCRLENLENMFKTGFYINDLSMHDSSRDLVLVGTQQSAELKLALDQEKQKSVALEDSMKKLDVEMKKTDQLLYQMLPKKIADRIRSGEPVMNLVEVICFRIIYVLE